MAARLDKDTLFLVEPDFLVDGAGPFYCNDCVPVEGFLSLYPAVRDRVEVRHVKIERPRQEVVDLLGPERQSLPVIVLADTRSDAAAGVKHAGGHAYLDDEAEIRTYLSKTYGVALQT